MESNPHWTIVSELIRTKGASDLKDTIFSNDEILNSEWLRLVSGFEQGYPQPKSHWPIKQLSYQLLCPECCTYRQTNSMRLAKEPSLGKKSFMSLIWTSEIFCIPGVMSELKKLRAKGFEDWSVVIHKTGLQSGRVRQIFIPGVADPGVIIDDDLERTICPRCNTTKYFPHVRGKMYIKRDALLSDVDFMLTFEWFGHGLLAWREMLVSNRIARLVLAKGWRGIRFKVIDLV